MSKPRRRHTAEQKAELLRQHVAEKKPVSEVCNEAAIQPSLFYTWQRELLAGAHTVFSTRRAPSRENELEAKISRLEARVARKDQIIAEVTEDADKVWTHRRFNPRKTEDVRTYLQEDLRIDVVALAGISSVASSSLGAEDASVWRPHLRNRAQP